MAISHSIIFSCVIEKYGIRNWEIWCQCEVLLLTSHTGTITDVGYTTSPTPIDDATSTAYHVVRQEHEIGSKKWRADEQIKLLNDSLGKLHYAVL